MSTESNDTPATPPVETDPQVEAQADGETTEAPEEEPVVRFDELNLPLQVLAGVAHSGFHQCTPIQAKSLPVGLTGRDVLGQAQTGTGKTAAFLITVFSRLLKEPRRYQGNKSAPRALVIAPTRELVVQIEKDAELLGRETGLKRLVVYGGVGYEQQRTDIGDGPDVLVGTPGRLIDYFRQGVYTLEGIEILVVDEADRMFDMGFVDDLRFMMRRMPPPGERQTLLYSATFPQRVKELAYDYMHEPVSVAVSPERTTADKITEAMYFVGNHEKFSLLVGILRGIIGGKTMVFVNTKRVGEDLEFWFAANGMQASFISGDVPQKKRLRLLEEFKSGELPVLIATDVASRGLHIDDVSHVINYDVPQDAEDYVHRIGRTARAGAEGDAITFGCETYSEYLLGVENFIGRKIPVAAPTDELFAEVAMPRRKKRPRPDGSGPGRGGSGRGGPGGGRGGAGRRDSGRGGSSRPPRRRDEGGGSGGGRRDDVARAQTPAADGNNGSPSGNQAGGPPAEGAAKKRRRRRRKKPAGEGGAAPTPS